MTQTSCNLEQEGWVDHRTQGDNFIKKSELACMGTDAQFRTILACRACELYMHCMPVPVIEGGQFVGVNVEV